MASSTVWHSIRYIIFFSLGCLEEMQSVWVSALFLLAFGKLKILFIQHIKCSYDSKNNVLGSIHHGGAWGDVGSTLTHVTDDSHVATVIPVKELLEHRHTQTPALCHFLFQSNILSALSSRVVAMFLQMTQVYPAHGRLLLHCACLPHFLIC